MRIIVAQLLNLLDILRGKSDSYHCYLNVHKKLSNPI